MNIRIEKIVELAKQLDDMIETVLESDAAPDSDDNYYSQIRKVLDEQCKWVMI